MSKLKRGNAELQLVYLKCISSLHLFAYVYCPALHPQCRLSRIKIRFFVRIE